MALMRIFMYMSLTFYFELVKGESSGLLVRCNEGLSESDFNDKATDSGRLGQDCISSTNQRIPLAKSNVESFGDKEVLVKSEKQILGRRQGPLSFLFPRNRGRCRTGLCARAGPSLIPERVLPAYNKRGQLWRRYYYLQYLKVLYNKYKKAYQREYQLYKGRQTAGVRPHILSGFGDYFQYSDYSDYYDYSGDTDYLGSDIFARIVKSLKEIKAEKSDVRSVIKTGNVNKDVNDQEKLLKGLPPLEDTDFEDFDADAELFNLSQDASPRTR